MTILCYYTVLSSYGFTSNKNDYISINIEGVCKYLSVLNPSSVRSWQCTIPDVSDNSIVRLYSVGLYMY